jgi:hypothetical protein
LSEEPHTLEKGYIAALKKRVYNLKLHHRDTENTEMFLCALCASVVNL